MSKEQGLLAEIERDLLEGKPLPDLLRKCIILGGRAGSQELRDWATQELKGYDNIGDLPPYRKVGAVIQLNGVSGNNLIRGQRISPAQLPDFTHEHIHEEAPLLPGVQELESTARHSEEGYVRLSLPSGADLVRYMNSQNNQPFQQITELYWSVSVAAITGCLDQVRTILAELTAELRATVPASQDNPTPAQASNAINVAVYGRRSRARVTVTTAQASGDGDATVEPSAPTDEEPAWWTLGRKVGAVIVGMATVAGAYWAYVAVR